MWVDPSLKKKGKKRPWLRFRKTEHDCDFTQWSMFIRTTQVSIELQTRSLREYSFCVSANFRDTYEWFRATLCGGEWDLSLVVYPKVWID